MNEYRPGGSFQILPPVIKNLIVINVLLFLLKKVIAQYSGINLDYVLGLFHWDSPYFRIWQPLTHIFMHFDFSHLLFNMLALWMFGNTIENVLGRNRFIILYFVAGFGAALCQSLVYYYEFAPLIAELKTLPADVQFQYLNNPRFPLNTPMIGASGAVYGVLFAFGYLFPNLPVYLYFLFPIKAKWLIIGYIGIELLSGFKNSVGDNVAHFAHLGGMLFAFLILKYWKNKRIIRVIN